MSNDNPKKTGADQPNDPAIPAKKLPGLAEAVEEIPEGDLEGVAGGMGCQGTCTDTHIST